MAILFTTIGLCGTGGKLSGKTLSNEGSPLPYVTILIPELDVGTQSDIQGNYYLLNIPPGKYDIQFSFIGYKTVILKEVTIQSDLTTSLNSQLEPTVIPGEQVFITAIKPLIQKDATSKIVNIGRDEIRNMPVENFQEVLVTRAGFTEDSEGGIHVRGGRTQEILYMIDGIEVNNSSNGSFDGLIGQNAIQELTIISGTFNAEFGTAMSGIVNIITPEGRNHFESTIEYKSDPLNDSRFHKPFAFAGIYDSSFVNKDLKSDLFKYIQSSQINYNHGIIPLLDIPLNGRSSFTLMGPGPVPRSTYFFSGEYRSAYNYLPQNIEIGQDFYLKLTSNPTDVIKYSSIFHSSSTLGQQYSHKWKYLPENNRFHYNTDDQISFIVTHTLQDNLFYTGSISRNKITNHINVRDLLPNQYLKSQTGSDVYFYREGNDGTFSKNTTLSTEYKLDLTYQVNERHYLKSGVSYTKYDLSIYNIDEPWEGGANFLDDSTFFPVESSFYIQDKIEYDFIILNAGFRFDKINPEIGMWENIESFGSYDPGTGEIIYSPVLSVPSQSKWSPRIGIAYPLTDRTVFHFSYGHFFQSPPFDVMAENARKNIYDWAIVGNSRVKPQKTISFETGIKQQLSQDIGIEITAWTKDIRDLLSATVIRHLSVPYAVYDNEDYASVKGIDLSFFSNSTKRFSGSLNYTLSVAKGNNATPLQGFFSAYEGEEIPHQEYYLDFDQRHRLSANINIHLFEDEGVDILGIHPFENTNTNILMNAASGLPYTPYVDPGIRVDRNSERKPWTFSIDLKTRRNFQTKFGNLAFLFEVKNLTNHENVRFVFPRTGDPFDTGFYGVGSTDKEPDYNPSHIGPGREISVGFRLDFI